VRRNYGVISQLYGYIVEYSFPLYWYKSVKIQQDVYSGVIVKNNVTCIYCQRCI